MFTQLADRFDSVFRNLRGLGKITDDNIQHTVRDIRRALLEADVALPVAREFIERVRLRAVGQDVMTSLTPGQVVIKIVHDELVTLMGDTSEGLNLNTQPPAVILMAGLQGAGKTTTVAKLGRWLKETQKKSVMASFMLAHSSHNRVSID